MFISIKIGEIKKPLVGTKMEKKLVIFCFVPKLLLTFGILPKLRFPTHFQLEPAAAKLAIIFKRG